MRKFSRRPLATLVRAPGLAQPLAVRLEAAGGEDAGPGLDRARAADRGRSDEARALELDAVDRRLVADGDAEGLGAAVVGVDQRLAAAEEEGIGAGDVQRARQRRLETHAVAAHPVTAGRRGADRQAGETLVGQAAGDLVAGPASTPLRDRRRRARPCGASCMQRMLRVCGELPPRQALGAASRSSTDAPASRAVRAAHNAALPPPITSTSSNGSFPRRCAQCTAPTVRPARTRARDDPGRRRLTRP